MRRLSIKMDLDRIWREKGAQSTPDGLFVLPAQVMIRTEFTDLSSNKRAQAKRKADTLRQILNNFDEKFQNLLSH